MTVKSFVNIIQTFFISSLSLQYVFMVFVLVAELLEKCCSTFFAAKNWEFIEYVQT